MYILQKSAVLAVSALALAACSSSPPSSTASSTASIQPSSDAGFSRALQSNYAALSNEEDYQKDLVDDSHYAVKSNVSGAGGEVWPDVGGSRHMRVFSEGTFWTGDAPQVRAANVELASARRNLMGKHDAGFARSHPAELARAQTQWDCWYEQQEEGYQLIHIERCRDGYHSAMAAMDPPAPAPAVAPALPGEVLETINFPFDSSELDYRARTALNDVAADVARRGNPTVVVVGHTDTSGSQAYNADLSIRRAEAVSQYLTQNGVSVRAIRASGVGEHDLVVQTGDDVRNVENRRATILVASDR